MRSRSCWFAISLILLPLAPAGGATVLRREIVHDIQSDGSVLQKERWRVRLDTDEDLEEWSLFPILLDENRRLERITSVAIRPDGKEIVVRPKRHDTVELAGNTLHSSQSARLVEFPALPRGSTIDVDYEVRADPYFPSGAISLGWLEQTASLRVEVRGAVGDWRWHIEGEPGELRVEEVAGGLVVRGEDLEPPAEAVYAPSQSPSLLYAWDDAGSWAGVGAWYRRLLADLPGVPPAVEEKALALVDGIEDPRQRLEAVLSFVRTQVRYVAVEVGIGGFRPSPTGEVLERRWGDCKDKSLLLIELLNRVGIDAYPALIRSGAGERIETDFPSPFQFNHLIVAAPGEGLGLSEEDPVAEGMLFVDPTQTRGSARWLHPGVQDQDALVIREREAGLVRTPIRQELEELSLSVTLVVKPGGEAGGGAAIRVRGSTAASLIERFATAQENAKEDDVRAIFGVALPGVQLGSFESRYDEKPVPVVDLAGGMKLARLVQGTPGRRSFALPGFRALPAASILEDRVEPVVLAPLSWSARWRIYLPEGWCPPQEKEIAVENDLGSVVQRISLSGATVTIERRTEVRRRWIEEGAFPELRELTLAEGRITGRRIRLRCPESG